MYRIDARYDLLYAIDMILLQGNRMKKYKKYVIIDQRELVNNEKIF